MSRRTYNQYCATARTLDVVGERWTLLIVRDLLTGPKRFSDLLAGLPGIGTGLLAGRLKFLQDEGLIVPVILPPPARVAGYALTEAGEELRPAVMALASWGLRWAMAERRADEDFQPGWAVLGMQALFNPDAARDLRLVYEFRVGDEVFHARVDHGAIDSVHGPAQRPDVTIETSPAVFVELAAGRMKLADAVRDGTATASGDRQAIRKLRSLFHPQQPKDRAVT